MTDHSSLLKEKNNSDIVERLNNCADNSAHPTSGEVKNRALTMREAAAEITRLRAEVEKVANEYADACHLVAQMHHVAPAQPSAQGEAVAWKLVPAKPTPEMVSAGRYAYEDKGWNGGPAIYRAMLAAAPAAPAQPSAPSSCGLTECKNMPKCDRCKAWDSMGI